MFCWLIGMLCNQLPAIQDHGEQDILDNKDNVNCDPSLRKSRMDSPNCK